MEKFISLCKSFYQTYTTTNLSMGSLVIEDSDSEDENEWNPKNSISPACLQFICKNTKLVIMYMKQHINAFLKILEIVIIPHYVIMSLVINILLDVKNNS